MDKVEALKPCPFCGGEAVANDFRGTKFKPAVSCVVCTADCVAPTLDDAITAWNRRSPPSPDAEALAGRLDRWATWFADDDGAVEEPLDEDHPLNDDLRQAAALIRGSGR